MLNPPVGIISTSRSAATTEPVLAEDDDLGAGASASLLRLEGTEDVELALGGRAGAAVVSEFRRLSNDGVPLEPPPVSHLSELLPGVDELPFASGA